MGRQGPSTKGRIQACVFIGAVKHGGGVRGGGGGEAGARIYAVTL